MTERSNSRGQGPEPLSSLMGSIVSCQRRPQFTVQQQARLTWLECNGALERRHTCGVYLAEGKRQGELPTLVVYIDSSALMQDFTTDHLLYVGRVSHAGLEVADVRFKLSHKRPSEPTYPKGGVTAAASSCEATSLPPLTPEQEEQVTQEVADLPDGLRDTAADAMRASLKWEMAQRPKTGE
ncbi:MAG: hypothetical protein LKE50_02230 [Atopobiaceae bacterium]|nr:hypothetical protein [Atopobiaceae bacterium]MCH4230478.1 hypothetical protein [Atopobiaceae bacterium]MDD2587808.1 hypothetical protein [Atopobiaceae bacterium]MDD3485038.1 hypothetical protein [Atopobiaceae bacterium]